MGSVSSVNPGVADLLQSLTAINSPVLSSQKHDERPGKALRPSDIVQLSVAANQLEGMDAFSGYLPHRHVPRPT